MPNQPEPTLNIIQDTREQDPLIFEGYPIKVGVDALPAGDYSLVGHDQPSDDFSVIIERKANCSELIGNLGTNWDRFERSLEKLAQYKHAQIVVCGNNNFDYLIEKDFTKLSLNFIFAQIVKIQLDYGIPIIFCGNRPNATNYIYRLFKRIDKKVRDDT